MACLMMAMIMQIQILFFLWIMSWSILVLNKGMILLFFFSTFVLDCSISIIPLNLGIGIVLEVNYCWSDLAQNFYVNMWIDWL